MYRFAKQFLILYILLKKQLTTEMVYHINKNSLLRKYKISYYLQNVYLLHCFLFSSEIQCSKMGLFLKNCTINFPFLGCERILRLIKMYALVFTTPTLLMYCRRSFSSLFIFHRKKEKKKWFILLFFPELILEPEMRTMKNVSTSVELRY